MNRPSLYILILAIFNNRCGAVIETTPESRPQTGSGIPPVPAAPVTAQQQHEPNMAMEIGDAIQQLMSLGFEYEQCLEAVNKFGTNVNDAFLWLSQDRHGGGNQQPAPTNRAPGANIREPRSNIPPSGGPIPPRSRGEATQQLLALGFEFSMCVEAVKKYGNDVDAAVNWLRSLGVIPGKDASPKPPPGPQSNEPPMSANKAGKQPVRYPPSTGGGGAGPINIEPTMSARKAGKQPMKYPPDTGSDQAAGKKPMGDVQPPGLTAGFGGNRTSKDAVQIGDVVQRLTMMGFDFDLCMEAANKFGTDISAATNWILSEQGINNIVPPQQGLPPLARRQGFPHLPPQMINRLQGFNVPRPAPQSRPVAPPESDSSYSSSSGEDSPARSEGNETPSPPLSEGNETPSPPEPFEFDDQGHGPTGGEPKETKIQASHYVNLAHITSIMSILLILLCFSFLFFFLRARTFHKEVEFGYVEYCEI